MHLCFNAAAVGSQTCPCILQGASRWFQNLQVITVVTLKEVQDGKIVYIPKYSMYGKFTYIYQKK